MLRVTRIAKRRDLSINSVVVVVCLFLLFCLFLGVLLLLLVVVVVVVVVVCLFLLLFFVGFGLLLLCNRHVNSTGASVLLQSISKDRHIKPRLSA